MSVEQCLAHFTKDCFKVFIYHFTVLFAVFLGMVYSDYGKFKFYSILFGEDMFKYQNMEIKI